MSDWRRIDIDAFDPESGRLKAEDLVPPYEGGVSAADVQSRVGQLRSMASSGDIAGAVQVITTDPPYNCDEQSKQVYLLAVLEALGQVRTMDIATIVGKLNHDQVDVLVKYLYRGMSIPEGQKQGGILLAWLEKVTQTNGVRPIVHYLSDRRTV
ncbi:Actin-related protein 2/3 complex subunit 5 [Nakaseomyces bracarensis]|uniref:Actin-related protein 2/3 complex subunit 5 n=1 Tax=Nakaseomyces bracarensis TaxID=273131 RepID=A0ABR4NRQ8_9SACH